MSPHQVVSLIMWMMAQALDADQRAGYVHQDVCNNERLTVRCDANDVIVMQAATLGRMELGKCIKSDFQIGCQSNALQILDDMCSGKRTCSFTLDVTDATFAEISSCPSDIFSYMNVIYQCHRVISMKQTCTSPLKVPTSTLSGTLSSLVTDATGCGSPRAPWLIGGTAGQRIKFTLIDFGWTGTSGSLHGGQNSQCQPVGFIIEPTLGVNNTICGGKGRETTFYESASASVQVVILPKATRGSKSGFLLHYEVTGCPDFTPPAQAWYKRHGDTATVGCDWGAPTWHLFCKGTTWSGNVGNCSEPVEVATSAAENSGIPLSPEFTIALIAGLGVLAIVLLCIIVTGYCCVRRKRRNSRRLTNQTSYKYGSSGEQHSMSLRYHPVRPDGSLHLPPDLNNRQTWCVNPIPMDEHHGLNSKPIEQMLQPEVLTSMPHYSTACRPHSMPPALPQKASGERHDNDLPPPLPPKQSKQGEPGEDYYWVGSHKYFVLDKEND